MCGGLRKCISFFSYFIDGELRASSWPSCWGKDECYEEFQEEYAVECVDELKDVHWYLADLSHRVPLETLKQMSTINYYWGDYRNMGGLAVSSIGYGLVAAALAESTDGLIASSDRAFDPDHNGGNCRRISCLVG